jgi:phage gp46-like protein
MTDVRLVQRGDFPYQTEVSVDWFLRSDGTLDDTQALATAVVVALGTDRLAAPQDILPDPDSTDRRGWWADLDAEEIWNGWPIGSRLWLLRREKLTGPGAQQGSTLVRVEYFIREAIQPFLDRRIGSRMDVQAVRVDKQRIDAIVRIYRGPELEIDLRYQVLWNDMIGVKANEPINPL